MGDQLTDKDLCSALSEIFVDTEVDFAYIASIVNKFELVHVEDVLLDWVSPILYVAFHDVAPPWTGYNEDWLWEEVEKVVAANNKAGIFGRIYRKLRRAYLRRLLRSSWEKLMEECCKQQGVNESCEVYSADKG